jgi:hypothetical protein
MSEFGKIVMFSPKEVSGNYVLNNYDNCILHTTGSSNATLTLPQVLYSKSKFIYIQKVDTGAGNTIVTAYSGDTIAGASSVNIVRQYEVKSFLAINTNQWLILDYLPWPLVVKDGNVGIGTTNPGAKLDIYESATINQQLILRNSGTYHTGFIGSSAANELDDNNAWGIFGGPNTYLTGIAYSAMITGGSGVPGIGIRFTTSNLNVGSGTTVFYAKNNGNVGIGTTDPDGQLSTGLKNGQQISYKSLTELTTIAAAAYTDTTIQIPANVIVKAVSVRVVTVIPTATTFTVTGATSTTVFNTAAVSTAAGSTNKGNLNCPYNNTAAQKIRITPNATPGSATGQVRVTIWIEDSVPPTS